jgi:hypothetical protein
MAKRASVGWNIGKAMSDHYERFNIRIGGMARHNTDKELIRYLKNKDFNYAEEYHEEPLGSHFLQYVANEKDPLSLTLKAHLYVENFLEEVLKKKFRNSSILLNNRDFTFALKVDVLRAKNYLDEKLYRDIRLLNRLRNKFAHDLSFDIATFDMSQFCYCEDLYQRVKTKSQEAKRLVNVSIFRHILIELLFRLTQRHEFIADIKKA